MKFNRGQSEGYTAKGINLCFRPCPDLSLCPSPDFCSEQHACTIQPLGRTWLLSAISHSSEEVCNITCIAHLPNLLPVQSLTGLRPGGLLSLALCSKNCWVCTSTAGGIQLPWLCTAKSHVALPTIRGACSNMVSLSFLRGNFRWIPFSAHLGSQGFLLPYQFILF